jgi:tetratricopeptide (TPR) repeat protein
MSAFPDSMALGSRCEASSRRRAGRFPFLDPLILVALCLLAYGSSLRYGFVSDDRILVTSRLSDYMQHFPFPDAFRSGFWKSETGGSGGGADSVTAESSGPSFKEDTRLDYYRPLVILSYALDARAGKGEALRYHLTNLLLHALVSILVWLILRRLTRARWIALGGALLFALEPIHVASVAWISGRTDLLATTFLLLAWLAWDRYLTVPPSQADVRPRTFGRAASLAACACCYALALLAKEIAISMILVFALYAWMGRPEHSRVSRQPWAALGLLVALTLAFVALRSHVLGIPVLGFTEAAAFRPGVPPAAYAWYLRMMCFPGTLHLFAPLRLPFGWTDPSFYLVAGILAGLLAGIVLLRRRLPLAAFGLAWFSITIAPMAHFVPLGLKTIVAEYWAYLPSVGWVLFLSGLAHRIAAGRPTAVAPTHDDQPSAGSSARAWAAPAVLLVLGLAGGAGIPARGEPLRSEKALLEHTIKVYPERVSTWISLAAIYSREGRMFDATRSLLRARRLDPDARGLHWVLGNTYRIRGLLDSAMVEYREELALHPDEYQVQINLANGLAEKGDEEGAAGFYRAAIRRSPRSWAVVRNQALDLSEAGQKVSTASEWPQADRSLGIAAGMLWGLQRAGAKLDASDLQELLNLELLLARPQRIREASRLLEAADAAGNGSPRENRQSGSEADNGAAWMAATANQLASLLERGDPAVPEAAALWTNDPFSAQWAQYIAGRWQETGRVAIAKPVWRALLRAHRLDSESLKALAPD